MVAFVVLVFSFLVADRLAEKVVFKMTYLYRG